MAHGVPGSVLLTVALTLVAFTVFSDRLERWNVSAPIIFVAVGWLTVNGRLDLLDFGLHASGVREIAEYALAFVLFGDAAGVTLRELRSDAGMAGRLLLIGLPITATLGVLVALPLFPSASWAVCAIIGVALAPTDAALGVAIIEDERVPLRVRSVLNVESGLNDGIVTPFVNLFIVAAVAGTAYRIESEGHAVRGLFLGVIGGIVVGAAGGLVFARARAAGLGATSYRSLGVAALVATAYSGMTQLNGNGFVCAFVAGLTYGAVTKEEKAQSLRFTNDVGRLLSLMVWFLFGALMLPTLANLTWQAVVFALLALTAVRMLPVALSLRGLGLDRATTSVIGWFGPRGLASVVFGLLAFESLAPADGQQVALVITTTVLFSVVLHGVSAAPVARWYGARHQDVASSAARTSRRARQARI